MRGGGSLNFSSKKEKVCGRPYPPSFKFKAHENYIILTHLIYINLMNENVFYILYIKFRRQKMSRLYSK